MAKEVRVTEANRNKRDYFLLTLITEKEMFLNFLTANRADSTKMFFFLVNLKNQ